LEPQIKELQQDATTEVLTLFPVEKRKGLLSYGLPESCDKVCAALLKNLVCCSNINAYPFLLFHTNTCSHPE
jgi:hypothetical protein